jgi:putative Holliday junction resolvase
MARILCLDVGTRRTGVAVSDETKTIAQGLPTIEHNDDGALVAAVEHLVKEYEVETVIVGLPLSLSGQPSARSVQVEQLANRLRNKLKLPVELVDERYTTTAAAEVLAESRGRDTRRSPLAFRRSPSVGRSDKDKLAANRIAATLILEQYLSRTSTKD